VAVASAGAVCKSAPRSRQTTTPAPHHSGFFRGRLPFLPPKQEHHSTEGRLSVHITITPSIAYDLSLVDRSAAVGRREGGRARLGVPRHGTILRRAADGQRVDAVGVAVAVAVVVESPAVARRPHEDRSKTATTLHTQQSRAWNALPSSVRSAPSSLLQFCRDLQTALHVPVIVLFTIVFGCVTDCNC